MARWTRIILFAASISGACAQPKELTDYLVSHFQTPEDYVVSKFKDHDLVFLGETAHGVRQNLLFLQRLIPRDFTGSRNLTSQQALLSRMAVQPSRTPLAMR